ncbi:MAG: hypothetical protein ACOCQW_05945 [Halanaerobiaceae bacterium]
MDKTCDKKDVIDFLNSIILSMASKQKVFDGLKSNIFDINIYTGYIDLLIHANLQLIGKDSDDKVLNYKLLIEQYLKDKIERKEVIENIKNDKSTYYLQMK